MAIITTPFCPHCGAQNLGSRFCENCGKAATIVNESDVLPTPFSYAPVTSNPLIQVGSPLNAVTLISYLAYVVLPTLVYLVFSNLIYGDAGDAFSVVLGVVTWGSLLTCGITATVAGFSSRSTPGRRVGGGMMGVLALVFILIGLLAPIAGLYSFAVALWLIPIALFISWAIARPFRGPGYFGLLIGIAISGLGLAIQLIPFLQYNYFLSSVVNLVVGVGAVLATVFSARAFEKNARPRPAVTSTPADGNPGSPGLAPNYAGHTNTMALMSMIFGLLSAGLVAVILGHVAKGQIRRTGEPGSGMATAGLVLGYIWLIIGVGVTIFYFAQFFSALNMLGGLRGY